MAYELFEIDRTFKSFILGKKFKMQLNVFTCDNCGAQVYYGEWGTMPDWFRYLTLTLEEKESGVSIRKNFHFCSEKCLLDSKCLKRLLTDFASKVKWKKTETKTEKISLEL